MNEELHINSFLVKFPEASHNTLEGFAEVKKEYTKRILDYFRVRNHIVSQNFVGDVEVYVKVREEQYGENRFSLYNRFGLKLNYSHIHQQPELIVSYERTMRVCKSSLQELSKKYAGDFQASFAGDISYSASPMHLITRVLHAYWMDDTKKKMHLRLRSLKGIEEEQNEKPQAKPYNKAELYPIVNIKLQSFFGIPANNDTYQRKNRYVRYLQEIDGFVKKYLTQDFRAIIPFESSYTRVEAGAIPQSASDLLFGKGHHNTTPRYGLNNGTYQEPAANNVVLFYIYPENFSTDNVIRLHNCWLNEYGLKDPLYNGLVQYLGVAAQGIRGFSITYDPNNPHAAQEIAKALDAPNRMEHFNNPNATFLCIYLSPISKNDIDPEQHELYYQVKETLLRRNIASQCVDTNKLLEQWRIDDQRQGDSFKYSLQNMSVAINAKLGGSPWILAGEQQRDLIIGIGAFRQNNHRYLGAAFMFNNVGAFNQYAYFSENSIDILAGAIQHKIEDFTKIDESPRRLIIHYYKQMNKNEERVIDEVLDELNLDIPVYVLTINETESESVFVFDTASSDLMPISGRYVALGNDNYLLCNNIRYENFRYPVKDFAFPIKIHLHCKTVNALTQPIKLELLQQVYQFSRIYWKSVSQQNMPVTIMYPKMLAEIMPHFQQKGVTEHIPNNRLWFL